MAQIVVNFNSEKEAQAVMDKLSQADIGEVRMRVLQSEHGSDYAKDDTTAPQVTPELGNVEVRPTETPQLPETQHTGHPGDPQSEERASAVIPTTGSGGQGVQVLVEFSDEFEEQVRKLLKG